MNQVLLRKQNYFFNNQIYTSYMGISISDNYETRIFFTYFYNIVTSVIGWVANNHVGFNGVDFCKIKLQTLFTLENIFRQYFKIEW